MHGGTCQPVWGIAYRVGLVGLRHRMMAGVQWIAQPGRLIAHRQRVATDLVRQRVIRERVVAQRLSTARVVRMVHIRPFQPLRHAGVRGALERLRSEL